MSCAGGKKTIFLILLFILISGILGFNQAAALTDDEKNNVAIYQKASPSVVNVISTVITRDFFLNPTPREGSGSGSIIDSRGHIMTNNHVIRDAQKLEVTLADGSKWPAKLVGTDPDNDLAVIKINAPPEKLKPLPFGDSKKLQVGQKVLAIGNPFGLGLTLTTGIISSLGRTIRSEVGTTIEEVIQTDASINPGNSGGPLLNSSGEIIGVNTAILSPTGVSVGIGFAIPVHTAKRIALELIAKGFVSYPYIGTVIHTIIPQFAKALSLPAEKGAMVVEVAPGGPADKAGLKGANKQAQIGNFLHPVGGDIIIQVDQLEVKDAEETIKYLRERKIGDVVNFKIIRDGKTREVKVTLQERPKDFRRKP
ncbi:MAG: trypsin-like peptidase domain-containing protein [Thermodesulfobacteriota bacterium]|nr:trypsin-like peptidase domain-containing protein [Thermodesulfobacteriota bacterium]